MGFVKIISFRNRKKPLPSNTRSTLPTKRLTRWFMCSMDWPKRKLKL